MARRRRAEAGPYQNGVHGRNAEGVQALGATVIEDAAPTGRGGRMEVAWQSRKGNARV
jgi:hypothetical protein